MIRSLTLAFIILTSLAGCAGSTRQENPVGIGASPNELKSSPCACITLPNGADAEVI